MSEKKTTSRARKPEAITKAEEFYIQHNISKGIDVIASDLERESSDIESVFNNYKKIEEQQSKITADNLMVKNKDYGVVIMTKEAAEIGDVSAKRSTQKEQANGPAKSIHYIKKQ
jgi:hypothetical protein